MVDVWASGGLAALIQEVIINNRKNELHYKDVHCFNGTKLGRLD
jgi:hypothetical protein